MSPKKYKPDEMNPVENIIAGMEDKRKKPAKRYPSKKFTDTADYIDSVDDIPPAKIKPKRK